MKYYGNIDPNSFWCPNKKHVTSYKHMHAHMHAHAHTLTHTHTHAHIHMYTCAYTHVYAHTRAHTHTHTHTHTRTHIHTHTRTHTYTHTNTMHIHCTHNVYTIHYTIHILIHRYLQEYTPLGTAGGLYHFRDQIARTVGSELSNFFVLNSDVCCDFPLSEMIDLQKHTTNGTGFVIMGTKVRLQFV